MILYASTGAPVIMPSRKPGLDSETFSPGKKLSLLRTGLLWSASCNTRAGVSSEGIHCIMFTYRLTSGHEDSQLLTPAQWSKSCKVIPGFFDRQASAKGIMGFTADRRAGNHSSKIFQETGKQRRHLGSPYSFWKGHFQTVGFL